MRLVAILLVLSAMEVRGGRDGYIGAAACARCHAAIAQSYAETGMARSFRSVQPDIQLPEFDGRAFLHEASRQTFTPQYSAGRNLVSRQQAVSGFQPYEGSVDYVLGSGDHARSYLHRTATGELIEFPVSWYARRSGYWQMSPGYDRPGHQGFSRQINYRCMFCHDAYPATKGQDGGTHFPSELPQGIDCERCHGPGEQHAKDARPTSTVNPARLPTERAMEVCLQCHLETTSGDLPGDRLRAGRDVFSYRPGEPLGDYRTYFDHAPNAGFAEKFEIVSSAYRLRQSACFRAQPAKLACTNCHDVHRASTRAETVVRASAVCVTCHRAGHSNRAECVSCHMPTREADDVPHVEITDHKIGTGHRTFSATPRNDDVPYAGAAVVYYPAGARAEPAPRPISASTPKEYTAEGQALLRVGDTKRAVEALRAAVNERPEIADIRVNFAAALIADHQYAAAREQLDEAIRTGPSTETARGEWERARAAGATAADAIAKFQASLKSQMLSAHSNLGVVLSLLGNRREAIEEFRRAVECDPHSETAKANLRRALSQN